MLSLVGHDLLTLGDFTPAQVNAVIERAVMQKRARKAAVGRVKPLEDKSVAIIMLKPSLRTRVSFELAVTQLGGTPVLTETGTPAVSRSDAVSLVAAAQSKVDLTGCPHCGGRSLQRWGQVSGLQRYRCGDCRRSFNALTGTPLARLRMKDRWQAQTEALITGESLAKNGETLRYRLYHRVPLASPVSLGTGARQTQPTHRDRGSRRNLYPGIVQGQASRPAASRAQARRQGEQERPVRRADSGSGRA